MKRSCLVNVPLLSILCACGPAPGDGEPEAIDRSAQPLAAATAKGVVPQGLPARLQVGLFEDTGAGWMRSSGAAWDVRYRYFTKGWVNNWGWSAYDGSWGLGYMNESSQQGYVPAIQYYQLVGESGGGEAQTLSKLQNASTMRSYFGDFKLLMQRAKDFGKPMYVLLEADAFGFIEQQAADNPNTYAAIAASGMPELAGLPNTVAGFGLAFLRLRDAAGASKAILGIHVSSWASSKEIAYFSVTDPLGPEVNKVYGFLSPFGLAANSTGSTFDVLVGDPLDRDSDYYRISSGSDRWWDASDGASIASKSFNRYAEWLRLWNQKASKRWVLWQIPLGNSNHKNVYNSGGSREGYKDNRPEYFFASGTAHLTKFADAGVIALLFGGGASGMSSYTNDTYTDGRLFMQSRAGAFLNAGGLAIADGRGGTVPDPVPTTPPPPPPPADPSQYGFESGVQGFAAAGAGITGVTSSTDRAAAGTHSLKVSFGSSGGSGSVRVSAPAAPKSATVSFRVWVPTGTTLTSVQPYVLQGAGGGWAWTGSWRSGASLTRNQWNTITVQVPANAAVPLAELGVELVTSGALGAAYLDAISW